jgi:multimeric flavodoxin WrbA
LKEEKIMTEQKIVQPKVLGIMGSPRRGGNTEILVDEVLRGAADAGAQTTKVILAEKQIGPCKACEACFKTGHCVQQDDMPDLLAAMQAHAIWVLGTPIYWASPSAYFKLFLDRWFGQGKNVEFKGRRVIAVFPFDQKAGETARQLEQVMVNIFTLITGHMKMELFATIAAPGVWTAGEVRERADLLAAAYRAGQTAMTTPLATR